MERKELLRVLLLGDVVGKPGRQLVQERVHGLRKELDLDLVIVNGENAAGGVGIDPGCAMELHSAGADILTSGDHTWHSREIKPFIEEHKSWCIRPDNYPKGAPGRGWTVWNSPHGVRVGVFNLMGRVFMNGALDCPFHRADELLQGPLQECKIRILDFHAEATSEKIAMGRHVDGRASLVVGTHTHVQTADAQILPQGTGYLSDLGMSGSVDGVIGMDSETALKRFITGLPHAYKLAPGRVALHGALATIEIATGRATSVERFRLAPWESHEHDLR